jgi:energy-converting hydrogenase Eha subunit F
MNESETNIPVQTELMDQIVALRHQVFTLLLALVVVSGTLTVVLYRQARLTGRDIDGIKPQATQIIAAFNRDRAGMENFVKQLAAYGNTHPDFQPILKKYGVVPPTQPAAAPAAPKK